MTRRTRIGLRVSPGSSRTRIVGAYDGGWKVQVAAPAEGGKANGAVVRLLADVLSLPTPRLRIVAGQTSRAKIIEIEGLTREAIDAALGHASGIAGRSNPLRSSSSEPGSPA
jgi:uncharacterized protein (TIGR00251 family)